MASEIIEKAGVDPIIQFSIFTDNKVGRLNVLLRLLNKQDIHIMAITNHETTDISIIRCVVNYPDETRWLLKKNDYAFSEHELLAVELDNPGQLKLITTALMEIEMNILYLYPFLVRPHDKLAVAVRLEYNDMAYEVLNKHGLKILSQSDIAR